MLYEIDDLCCPCGHVDCDGDQCDELAGSGPEEDWHDCHDDPCPCDGGILLMTNKVTLESIKFVNVRTGEESFGYCLHDDYAQVYDNTLESIPDDDIELLSITMQSDQPPVISMVDYLYGQGLFINDVWYTWTMIKHLWSDDCTPK